MKKKPIPIPSLELRRSGILLHLTSLPGPYFNGDLGKSAFSFIDFLRKSNQSWWQMLPINPIGKGDCPYSTISSFASEELLIDLEFFEKTGHLTAKDLKVETSGNEDVVDYQKATKFRKICLKKAFQQEQKKNLFFDSPDFRAFKKTNKSWLEDYCLFQALTKKFRTTNWTSWPPAIKQRSEKALLKVKKELAEEISYLELMQFVFNLQWSRLRDYSHENGVGLIGDLPIFVSLYSADVWANRELFFLNKDGTPTVVAGVPPDYYNPLGQLWGNALYNWGSLKKTKFRWWISRLKRQLAQFDVIRLDHFIGFHNYWEIPAKTKDARKGSWVKAPGDELFKATIKALGRLPVIAEDLGLVTPEVWALRDKYNFPGMRVIQFSYDDSPASEYHRPYNYAENSVVYTGTHDNDTIVGWYEDLKLKVLAAEEKAVPLPYEFAFLKGQIGSQIDMDDNKVVAAEIIKTVMDSPANLAIIPMQDILALPKAARMNVPGLAKGNWRWRMMPGAFTDQIARKLKTLAKSFGRI